jgi:hypothetical protein
MRRPSWLGWLCDATGFTRRCSRTIEVSISRDDFPIPQTGLAVTHLLVVFDQDRSSEFYRSVFGATVALDAIGSSRADPEPVAARSADTNCQALARRTTERDGA